MKGKDSGLRLGRHPELFGLTTVRAYGVTGPFDRHVHHTWCLGAVTRGTRTIILGGRPHTARPGDVFAIPPGAAHQCAGSGPGGHDYLVLCLADRSLAMAAGAGRATGRLCLPVVVRDPALAALVPALFQALEAGDPALARGLVCTLAAGLANGHGSWTGSPRPGARPEIEQARKRIAARVPEAAPLAELAGSACLSPHHFLRLFTAQVGVPPHAYAVQARVKSALALLGRGMDIARVAAETGFADQSHLGRHFKRNVGVTPGAFQRHNPPEKYKEKP